MLGVSNGNRFVGVIKKGISGIQDAYAKQKKVLEERARQRVKNAKTKLEDEHIKADLELEKLKLPREMYEAKAAVKREKVAVAKVKKEARAGGVRERAEDLARSAGRVGGRFFRGLVTEPKRKRKTKGKK